MRTLLAAFDSTDAAGAAVSAIIGARILPAAIEMMDRLTIEAAEAAVRAGYPEDANAVLIVELDGVAGRSRRTSRAVEAICLEHGAFEIRVAADDAERALLWKGRKRRSRRWAAISRELLRPGRRRAADEAARGAAPDREARGRARPARRQRLPRRRRQPPPARALRRRGSTASRSARASWPTRSSTPASTPAARSPASTAIGVDKACSMPLLFSEDDLEAMQRLRRAFDPGRHRQPGQALPDAAPLRRGAGAVPRSTRSRGGTCRASLSRTS